MQWPTCPIEKQSSFIPPHCPWTECAEHLRQIGGYRCRRHGVYRTARGTVVPRFRCLSCDRTFSRQTFSVTYYRKRPELIRPIAAGLVAGSALRQLARSLQCAPTTVVRISALLGRHAVLFNARCARSLRGRVSEPFVMDHFETFEASQDYPFGVATVVGAESWYVYALDPAPHPRTGKPSRSKRSRRKMAHRRPPRRNEHGRYVGSVGRVLDSLGRFTAETEQLVIRTDGHPHYGKTIRSHRLGRRVEHRSTPGPRRELSRKGDRRRSAQRNQALFPVDLLHRLFRHSMAHHRRETIAFSRRINAAMERFALVATWRNFVKRMTERRRCNTSPAMLLGLTDQLWSWERVLARRIFFFREELPAPWGEIYRREWTTPLLGSNERHQLKRNF